MLRIRIFLLRIDPMTNTCKQCYIREILFIAAKKSKIFCLLLDPHLFSWPTYSSTLKMEAVRSSGTSENLYQATWCHITEENFLLKNELPRSTGDGESLDQLSDSQLHMKIYEIWNYVKI